MQQFLSHGLRAGLLTNASAAEVSDTTGDAMKNCSRLPTLLLLCMLSFITTITTYAQDENSEIKYGNDAYKKGDYKNAEKYYRKALEENNSNVTAKFNLGNALVKQNNIAEAIQYYTQLAEANSDDAFKSKALYNKGITMIRAQKLPEAIEAFKQSLLLNPEDNETRENLQKALTELQKRQQNQPRPQQQQKKPDPKKQQNKMPNRDVMEQKFEELKDKEKQLQKLLQRKSTGQQPDKDW
ncbi:tetratricopeptide repeat protein [Panacibacter sp. DH6]|uniref:Tetratricopeptide repeat protein n=1 Tax=Panacibacter microcysteis TaxID=2793269 RepID=A0A931E497_9BACT|nr:tetratricopeptide repeat protein [Panacibacter microcysteis]MBG9375005.1 tetratricopeptide repeat protein [Panacibacter microcysteis]